MRVIVCGGRNYSARTRVYTLLDAIHAVKPIRTVVHGDARGADTLAKEWAQRAAIPRRVEVEAHPADWSKHGKRAGPIRNRKMADVGADLCIAFPGGRGTSDMILKATAAWIPVLDLRGVS